MRRFSQRNSLVTLNEINITPLLDLAFVLLIIFVITRPLLEQSVELNLPEGGQSKATVERKDILMVEITKGGDYRLNGTRMTLPQMLPRLLQATKVNPKSVVYIRADRDSYLKYGVDVIDSCTKQGITRFSIATAPDK